jgi:Response regulators consisting of a CheY-like receiver domain and a winged-helix DNA-binding domain
MKHVLVVEDEYAIRDLISLNLRIAGYEVIGTDNAETAMDMFSSDTKFDVAILDIMLPGMSGLELCSILRRENQNMGIIILSARTQEKDKIEGLSIGADDYMTKPFSVGELVARVEAVCRRSAGTAATSEDQTITSGDFVLDKKSRIVTKRGEELDLTQVEFQLMEMFFDNPGVALDRDRILKEIWGKSYYGDVKIVDVNICRLRMKIEDEANTPKHIVTVWGYGYRWN